MREYQALALTSHCQLVRLGVRPPFAHNCQILSNLYKALACQLLSSTSLRRTLCRFHAHRPRNTFTAARWKLRRRGDDDSKERARRSDSFAGPAGSLLCPAAICCITSVEHLV